MSRSPGCVPGPSRLQSLALVLVALSAWPAPAVGQAISLPTIHAAPRAGSIEIDGRLHERDWTTVDPFDAFVQGEPMEGVPAEAPTSVRVLYDRDAIYIGARMDDPEAGSIARQLTRRGEVGDAVDHFEVSFDSNNDRRTAYTFRVTAAGVQSDRYRYDDTSEDGNWEAVWAAAVHHDEGGWSVEMRIPLSQLRFEPSDEPQSWGINFARRRVQSNEVSYFALESRERYGGVSIFGRLEGLELPRATRRIEVRPYTLGMTRGAPAAEANPFFDGSEHQGKVGADVRYGLGSTFVLDLTVNPDFGQVEVDPAVINLTAFETFFPERRPFFTRDDRIFDFELTGPRNNLFYSRRIGRSPQGSVPAADFTSVPGETRILGAAKVTGRTRDGFNIGVLVALTPVEKGRLFDRVTAETRDFEVEPQTIYGVLRASREFRGGDSHAGAIFTTTQRSLSSSARLLDELNSASYTGGVDFKHSWGDRGWQLAGIAAASTVRGSPQAILRTQTSSTHYFQRPDADPVRVDSTATSLTGGEWRLQIDRRTGRHWTWTAWAGQRAPGLEVNDIGYAPDGERIHGGGRLTYAEITPGRWLRSYRLSLFGFNRFRHEALDDASSRNHWMEARDGAEGTASGNFTFLNYWNVNLGFRYKPELLSSTMTRGGPLMVEPATRRLEAAVTSDRRRRFSVRPWINHRTGRAGGGITDTGIDLSFRPADRIRITLDPTYSSALDVAQYVARFADPGFEATYGERYLFSDLRRQTLSVDTRLDVVFSPRMSLQFFAQPLVSSGEYQSYKQLMHSSSFDFERLTEGSFVEANESASCAGGRTCVNEGVRYLDLEGDGVASRSISDRDFLIRSLRSSAVLRWEYRPGSVAYLVWQHGRLLRENKHGLAAGDLGRIFDAPMENILIVKLNYWLGI